MDYIFALSALSWPFYLKVEQDEKFRLLILSKLDNLVTNHEYSLLCYGMDKICSNGTPTIQNLKTIAKGQEGNENFQSRCKFHPQQLVSWGFT